ncbi:glycosyltransferase family 2 protein [Enterobacter roggenkampii]|uniref:glycosyltransferase family 2 protein n=1 Tax=Enterobacter roggenkampii TaxID=1812935 RepID=UPI002006502A|nr:glycosyltransferase [Enterobacter roggenkampii]MCK7120678.1 glycosyltransferase [Enterobacter roggenkampii]MDK9943090.1 glycosyltransferase [Enterobacter roggenkampii]MDK9947804.1 glycosyltransferase [Enterobacter roggenkampii]
MQYQSDRVSIIIISYNHEQFIEDAIESILCQTYKHIELIIVDNNSSDTTPEILKQYKDVDNIKVIFLESNTGITGGINEGLKYASGEFVSFFASDDIMISNRIELQVNSLKNEPEAIACFGNMLRINSDGSINKRGLLPVVGFKWWTLNDILTERICLYSPTQLYRTHVFRDDLINFPKDIRIEDIWLYFKLLNAGYRFITIPYLLTLYRVHDNNTHTRYKMMMLEKIKILNSYKEQAFYKKALNFIYLEHFSNFGSTSKKDALKLLPKVILSIKSKYLYIGLVRLFFDWRS